VEITDPRSPVLFAGKVWMVHSGIPNGLPASILLWRFRDGLGPVFGIGLWALGFVPRAARETQALVKTS
jgi:hypothetical protein